MNLDDFIPTIQISELKRECGSYKNECEKLAGIIITNNKKTIDDYNKIISNCKNVDKIFEYKQKILDMEKQNAKMIERYPYVEMRPK